ncbi:hypothetical protein [Undibacterium crateris]|uniref:hypothetical protein n=1 Tax=Undibacterium crateris TaxID=2528175 RepID=UPI00138A290A|nr:hypothetical protein [Undibacterium crateris]NDI85115.1 hypothetical protein [Undibacterium crateris]
MLDTEKPEFLQALRLCFGAYDKSIPETSHTWWDLLSPYPLKVVASALAMYVVNQPEFPPIPAAIMKRCREMDGRPGDEEAWAIALRSKDQRETVVWTAEMAEAFGLCESILNVGDKVGARMSFKENYNRLVANARIRAVPASWSVSIGFDKDRQRVAIGDALRKGLIRNDSEFAQILLNSPSTPILPMLSAPPGADAQKDYEREKIQENIRRMRDLISGMEPADQKIHRISEARIAADRKALERAKADAKRKTMQYRELQ